MNNSLQHQAAFKLLDAAGVQRSNYAPPVFRMLWNLGINVPPPHFMSFLNVVAFSGTGFGILWGVLMFAFASVTGEANIPALLLATLGAGLMFGVAMATYYANGRRRYKLPSWSSLGRSDAYPLESTSTEN